VSISNQPIATPCNGENIGIHLDVGHDSIGWAVSSRDRAGSIIFPGCGTVIFQADDCLASHRRQFRRQRRHIRSTRQRIERMGKYLVSQSLLTPEEIQQNTCAWPWKLAAGVLVGTQTLSWPQMWSVLRWYAHNRGYDGNALWSAHARSEADEADIKKNQASHELMAKYNTNSMAGTICAVLKVDPSSNKKSSSEIWYKGENISFDRFLVIREVSEILDAHLGVLEGLTQGIIDTLVANPLDNPNHLREHNIQNISVPRRFLGGLLFGQLAPRFDNRIIGICPISGDKLPLKASIEFLDFRWAMAVKNIRVGAESRMLTKAEIAKLNNCVGVVGGFTKGELRKAVSEITGTNENNLEGMLTSPEAERSFTRYPGLYVLKKEGLSTLIPENVCGKIAHALMRGKNLSFGKIAEEVSEKNQLTLESLVSQKMGKGKKRAKTEAEILDKILAIKREEGRAPYSREVMKKAVATIFEGKDPTEIGGMLYRDATKADVLPSEKIDTKTNNHLVRHRIKIVVELVKDIVEDYAENNPCRVSSVTIELARDLKDMSGKTNKEIEKEMGQRTAHHKKIAQVVEDELGIPPSASLIRKGRIADDLDYTCPYTGMKYDIRQVVSKAVDLDHILPRSQRPTDSLDSLALTFKSVNTLKSNRTALEFIQQCGGQAISVPEHGTLKNVEILTENAYLDLLKKFNSKAYRVTHKDDLRRMKRRVEKLKKLNVKDEVMTDGMLTRTSYITSLASQALRGYFQPFGRIPPILSIPGRITAAVRMQWNILGILAQVDSRLLDTNKELRLKSEIRSITHMHHAVDAITLGLTSLLIPANGTVWALMAKRRLNDAERALMHSTGAFNISAEGRAELKPLKELSTGTPASIKAALTEQRVVVHIPARKDGIRIEQNVWGITEVDSEAKTIKIRQRARDPKTNRIKIKTAEIPESKAFGFMPKGGEGKLSQINGIQQFSTNYALALDPEPAVIRHLKVWEQIGIIKARNGGKMPRLIRRSDLISIPKGKDAGVWRILSIKDAKAGFLVDMVRPQAIKAANKTDYSVINRHVNTLVQNGVKILKPKYTGVAQCPIMSSTSPRPKVSSPARGDNS